jgi:hypothetical protein
MHENKAGHQKIASRILEELRQMKKAGNVYIANNENRLIVRDLN